MKKLTVMRKIRLLHGISLKELAEAVSVSTQYMSNIELGDAYNRYSQHLEKLVQEAFEAVILRKKLRLEELSKSYFDNKDRILEYEIVEDDST